MKKHRYVDIDEAMPILDEIRLDNPNPLKTKVIDLCKDVLKQLPAQEIEELVTCSQCYFCNKDNWHCMHDLGLPGRLKPNFYCRFGAPTRPEDYDSDTILDDKFEEFDDAEA